MVERMTSRSELKVALANVFSDALFTTYWGGGKRNKNKKYCMRLTRSDTRASQTQSTIDVKGTDDSNKRFQIQNTWCTQNWVCMQAMLSAICNTHCNLCQVSTDKLLSCACSLQPFRLSSPMLNVVISNLTCKLFWKM